MAYRLAVSLALALGAAGHACFAANHWPVVSLPSDVNGFDIGQQVSVKGLPMRLRGFVSKLAPQTVAQRFRQSMGRPLVENTMGNKLVLGRAEGAHFVSVQIEATGGSGTRGIVSVTQLKTALDAAGTTRESARRWLDRLPAGTRLVSQMESTDGPRLSKHLVVTNTQSESLNRDRLVGLMADEGLSFERESSAGDRNQGRLMFFTGAGKEAIATLHVDGDGQTTVVFNIVVTLERMR